MVKHKSGSRRLDISLMLRVSRFGSGYYMRIPSDIGRSLMLKKGDYVELKFVKVVESGGV